LDFSEVEEELNQLTLTNVLAEAALLLGGAEI